MKLDSLIETRRVQHGLKALLKKRRYTYPTLARDLGVSLPTVKRMLTAPDISLGRVTEICHVLGVRLHEFLEVTRENESDLHYFTPDQEAFFAENPPYLYYLLALHNTRKTPTELEKLHGLSKRSTHKYVTKLRDLGLIQLLPRGRVRTLINGMIGWDDRGPLGDVCSNKVIRALADRAIERTSPDLYLELSGRFLTAAEYETMKAELSALTAKYRRISKVNSATKDPATLRRYQAMIVADRAHPDGYAEIAEL